MTGEVEAVANIATGGIIAGVVERELQAGGRNGHGGTCLNCGTALMGSHCHACGQNGHIHRSLGAIGHEILHGVVHFEGKIWRTLPLLFFRPGELTRRYIAGERTRFVSPMAMFLFSVFTLFAVFSIMGIAPPAELGAPAQVEAGLKTAIAEAEASRKEAAESLAALPKDNPGRAALERRLAERDDSLAALRKIEPVVHDKAGATDFKTGIPRIDHGIEKWHKNPGLMLYKLQSNSYKFSWLLIPISLPFVWMLFFWKRGVHFYDHMVFVTYSLSFMSLLFIILTILGGLGIGMDVLGTIGMFMPMWHIFAQLRGAYRLRRRTAFLRAAILITLIPSVIVPIFTLALMALGLMG